MSSRVDITELLRRANEGERQAANELFQLVEDELKAIAGRRKLRFVGRVDVSTTMLVDDAFLKLVGKEVTDWNPGDRRKFFSYAATKVHDLLVDAARAQTAQKRGRDFDRVRGDLDHATAADSTDPGMMVDLKDALGRLEQFAAEECAVFRMRYLLGCTFEETAQVMSMSVSRAKRQFAKAQMLLRRELRDYNNE